MALVFDSAGLTDPTPGHPLRLLFRRFPPPEHDLAMYHTIEFDEALTLDLELTRKHPLERVSVLKGTRVRVQLRPHVIETDEGPVEAADLFFEDGTTSRSVPFASFSFVD